jgi:hypothetical protein
VANRIDITIESPDDILHAGAQGAGAIIRLQWSATETGAFVDVSGTGSTPTIPIVAGQRYYTGRDPTGDTSTWYRYRYEDVGAVRPSNWSPVFQVGDETGGLICSVEDVEQEIGTLTPNERESVFDKIRQVTVGIEGYCHREFVPRPLSGTMTRRFHTSSGGVIRIPKGIRSVTTLGYASSDQPATGGTYTTIVATDFYLDPPDGERDAGWPATRLVLLRTAGARFYQASFGVQIEGEFGWASVPYDIQGVAIRAVIRRHIGKGGGGGPIALGPEGTEFLLPDMSGSDRRVLDYYRHIPV